MYLDPENTIVKLCAQGIEQEMAGKPALAKQLYQQAWEKASDEKEKFTAAHYMARLQDSPADKLKWDQLALDLAQKVSSDEVKGAFSSLYLNIAKGHEDLLDFAKARQHYRLAQSFTAFLHDDGYGKMTRAGIEAGIERTREK
jgi:rifampin ADP-ribosylating transferase